MRRLLVAAVMAGAAFGVSAPASAVPCYGVQGGDVITTGVCAGGECTDLCFIVVDPYCSGMVSKTNALQPCHLVDAVFIR